MVLYNLFLAFLAINPVFCPPAVSQYSEQDITQDAPAIDFNDFNCYFPKRKLRKNISKLGGRSTGFACDNGKCIDGDAVCDGKVDCNDKSDELKSVCSLQTYDDNMRTCRTWNDFKGFICDNGQCIYDTPSDRGVCNGFHNCLDKSDESSSVCSWKTYPHVHNVTTCNYMGTRKGFVCDNGKCIDDRYVCDEWDYCGDKSNKKKSFCGLTCPHDPRITTMAVSIARGDCRYCEGGNRWRCDDGRQCIPKRSVCDGKTKQRGFPGNSQNCKDKSDEMIGRGCITCLLLTAYSFQMPMLTSHSNRKIDVCDTPWYKHYKYIDPTDKSKVFCPNGKTVSSTRIGLYQVCNGQVDCPSGIDEYNCSWYVYIFFTHSYVLACIALAMVSIVALLWLLLYKSKVAKPKFANIFETNANMIIIDEFVKEVFSLINSAGDLSRSTELRENYIKIRRSRNSLKILIESLSFTFIEPKSCHEISKLIMNLEKSFQHNKRKRCLLFFRKKLGSNSETEKFIYFLKEPGYLQQLTFIWTKFSDNRLSCSCTRSILKIALVIFASSFFFFDILKDISLYLLLQQYLNKNPLSSPIEIFLVHTSLGCLLLSHAAIGLQCLLNWPEMFQSTEEYSFCKRVLFFLVLFPISPLLPTIVAMHGVCVSLDKDTFIAQYRKNPNSMDIYTLMAKIKKYDFYLSVNAKNYAYMRIVESMLEASPQVLVIILLAIWQYATGSSNGVIDLLVQSENSKSLILFVLSVPSSIITIILSILKFTSTFKQGSIGLKASFIICVGYFLMFVAKICALMTILSPCYIVYNSLTDQYNITRVVDKNYAMKTVLNYTSIRVLNVPNLYIPFSPLLPNYSWVPHFLRFSLMSLVHPFLPVALSVILLSLFAHVVFVFIYCHKHVPDFKTAPVIDQVFHCLANLLVPIPFHSFTETPQRLRWKEYRAYILSSLTTSVLIFMGSVLARQSSPQSSNLEYLWALYTTLNYEVYSIPTWNMGIFLVVPYDHSHKHIFALLCHFHELVARFLNIIFHIPWLLLIFFLHGLGVYVLSFYYRRLHLWSSLFIGSINRQHTADELIELIEEGTYEEEEENDEDKGSCLMLVNCFSHSKDRLKNAGETICSSCCQCSCRCHPKLRDCMLNCFSHSKDKFKKVGETIGSRCSPERCQRMCRCNSKFKDCTSPSLWCRCLPVSKDCVSPVFCCRGCTGRSEQEDVEEMVLEIIPLLKEDINVKKEESAQEICCKIVEEIFISSLLLKPESQEDPEGRNIASEGSLIVTCDIHQEQKEFYNKFEREESAQEICSNIIEEIIIFSLSQSKSQENLEHKILQSLDAKSQETSLDKKSYNLCELDAIDKI